MSGGGRRKEGRSRKKSGQGREKGEGREGGGGGKGIDETLKACKEIKFKILKMKLSYAENCGSGISGNLTR